MTTSDELQIIPAMAVGQVQPMVLPLAGLERERAWPQAIGLVGHRNRQGRFDQISSRRLGLLSGPTTWLTAA
ncbi:MAG TPA: hypothetical protein VI199_08560 [Novosphingobium sp.]